MKKLFLLLTFLILLAAMACSNGAKDNKNQVEAYPNTDTTRPMENLNNAPVDSSNQQNEQNNRSDQ